MPGEWLDEGRAWNEGHALRNFLYANDDWDITVFNDYFHRFHRDVIAEALPPDAGAPRRLDLALPALTRPRDVREHTG